MRQRSDYVIVGGGSAGCVLAARLSENPRVRVCLVEAGPMDTADTIRIPLYGGQLLRTHLDWDYDTHDEPALHGRRLYLPRGRVLGGSSAMNGMVYMRGNPLDYDGWQQPGWSFADLLPYFLRSEDNERGASAYHGVGGPLAVADGRSNNPITSAFVEAAGEAGFPANSDFNGESQDGFGRYQLTQRNGERCSSAAAYLRPVLARPNLTVLTNVQVQRITFTGDRATGVVGTLLDESVEVAAEREVILCAGGYNSPQLLMLSGIGDAAELVALGIPVVLDQPEVGRNLQDHPQVNLVYTHSQPVSLLTAGEPEHLREYNEHRTGPLSSNVPEAGGFIRTDATLAAPDVQFHACPLMITDAGMAPPTAHGISFGPCLLTPRSRGSVTLASPAPTAKPRIRHDYYSEDSDLAVMVAGVRAGLEIARQGALGLYTEQPVRAPESESDDDVREFVRRNTQTLFHPSGTCAMGTVVDADLRVRGVQGLRVVDASVMPTVVRGNTNAPVIAIAERAADLIRGITAPAPAQALSAAAGRDR
ncbi:GMC family oxidoreductase N-terminal domain-containing protein [Micromonospora sp. NPDC049523]|uniref:GMC family oxidoreductase n=1 Tax=Micromonospora sp. NPDC049523 TaxID=3155921 RepID=UPI00343AD3DE